MKTDYKRVKKMGQEEAHARELEYNDVIEDTYGLVQYLELLQNFLKVQKLLISDDNTSEVQQSWRQYSRP